MASVPAGTGASQPDSVVNAAVDDMEFASARRDLVGWQGRAWPAAASGFVLPGILYHHGVDGQAATVGLSGNNGVLGTIVQVSASFIILFVTCAAFLRASKAGDYLNDLALARVGRARGGPAKAPVVSGILFGTISGSAVANVAASGAFTLPVMRRVGYDRNTAAAVEATSSAGGRITPPVALASFAAASMAGADRGRTSVIAMKLGLAAFIVPFMFWLSPALLAQGDIMTILQAFITASSTEGCWPARPRAGC
jgi:TRAP-type uncharacterized transport system fused permease subunit